MEALTSTQIRARHGARIPRDIDPSKNKARREEKLAGIQTYRHSLLLKKRRGIGAFPARDSFESDSDQMSVLQRLRILRAIRLELAFANGIRSNGILVLANIDQLVLQLSATLSLPDRGDEEKLEATFCLSLLCESKLPVAYSIHTSATPLLVAFLSGQNSLLAEQSAWCLGNLAADGPIVRGALLSMGKCVVDPLAHLVAHRVRSTARTAAWALANLIGRDAAGTNSILEAGAASHAAKWVIKQVALLPVFVPTHADAITAGTGAAASAALQTVAWSSHSARGLSSPHAVASLSALASQGSLVSWPISHAPGGSTLMDEDVALASSGNAVINSCTGGMIAVPGECGDDDECPVMQPSIPRAGPPRPVFDPHLLLDMICLLLLLAGEDAEAEGPRAFLPSHFAQLISALCRLVILCVARPVGEGSSRMCMMGGSQALLAGPQGTRTDAVIILTDLSAHEQQQLLLPCLEPALNLLLGECVSTNWAETTALHCLKGALGQAWTVALRSGGASHLTQAQLAGCARLLNAMSQSSHQGYTVPLPVLRASGGAGGDSPLLQSTENRRGPLIGCAMQGGAVGLTPPLMPSGWYDVLCESPIPFGSGSGYLNASGSGSALHGQNAPGGSPVYLQNAKGSPDMHGWQPQCC